MDAVHRVSAFLQVGPEVITSQQWAMILPALLDRAVEFEQLKSQNVVLEVDLEQANRNAEQRIANTKDDLDATRLEVQQLRAKDPSQGIPNGATVQQLQALQRDNIALEDRIRSMTVQHSDLLEDKRHALALVDRQTRTGEHHEDDYKALADRYHKLRQSTITLENQVHEAQAHASNSQFKLHTVEQELKLSQKNADWLGSELETKLSDFATYRKETGSVIATTQQEADVAKAQAASLEISNETHRRRICELTTGLEQHMTKVQALQDELITKEETFRIEMTTQAKLTDLHEQSAKDAKLRIDQLEHDLEMLRAKESQEIEKWVQSNRVSQDRIANLEAQVNDLQLNLQQSVSESAITTEQVDAADPDTNGLALLSPSAQLLSKIQKSGMSMTQLFAEFHTAKQELEHEQRKNERIQASFDDLIQELELRAPQLQEQREEFSNLQRELAAMSEANQQICAQRELAERQSSTLENANRDQARELLEYQQQIADLSRQVQRLLFEIEEQGFRSNPLTEAEVTALNRLLNQRTSGSSAVDNLISERLILFKNLQELQQQNEQHLRITRQLGAKMEREEEANRKRLEDLESSALTEANAIISRLNTETRSMQVRMESYVRERDMFRRMLTQNTTNESSSSQPEMPFMNISETSGTKLQEIQDQFETFKTETATDRQTLTQQLAAAVKDRNDLALQVARISSQLSFTEEKHKMLIGSVDMMRREVEESRKRMTQLQELSTDQDRRAQHIADELIDNKSSLESLRSETAHLKAEKLVYKSIEQRMSQEIESLHSERTGLSNLVANLQSLHSERERIEEESNRRTAEQIRTLQAELDIARTDLSSEREEVRRLNLHKDQAGRDVQEKIENLLRQCADAREALATAHAERDHSKARGLDLESAQRVAQETILALSSQGGKTEQELQAELADVRLSLEQANRESEQARLHAQKMQELSANSEEALSAMNESHDEFVASIETQLEAKEKEKAVIEGRVKELTSDLRDAREQLKHIQEVEDLNRHSFEHEIAVLKNRLAELQDFEEKFNVANSNYQEDLRCQAEIAQEAHQNYENELVKHAEATQSLRLLREDYNAMRTEILALRKESNSSEARLANEGQAWANQKSLYEQELSELRARIDDLRRQNDLLHAQFGTYTAQMSHRSNSTSMTDQAESNVDNVHEIIRYLRREKEIVETSHERLQQEHKRTRQQLAQMTEALDEMQMSLVSEKEKASQKSTSAAEHVNVLAKLDDLKLIRESNTTLRADNERNVQTINSLEAELLAVTERIEPLEAKMRVLTAEQQAKDEEIKLLTEDNTRWKERNQSILQKYERIDPAELKELRENSASANGRISELEQTLALRESAAMEKDSLVTSLQEQVNSQASRYDQLMQQSRDRIKKERTDAKKNLATAQDYAAQIELLTAELATAKGDAEADLTSASAKDTSELQSLRSIITSLETQLSEKNAAMQSQASSAATELAAIKATSEALKEEHDARVLAEREASISVDHRSGELEDKIKHCLEDLQKQKSEFAALKSASELLQEALDEATETIVELKGNLEMAESTHQSASRFTEQEVLQRIAELTGGAVPHDSFQSRIAEAITDQKSSEPDSIVPLQKPIDDALTQQPLVTEEAIQKRIEEAVAAAKAEIAANGEDSSISRTIDDVSRDKDEETKTKARAITKERVDQIVEQRLPKMIEAEKQNWIKGAEEAQARLITEKDNEWKVKLDALEAEAKEKLKSHGDSVRKESTMRVALQMKGKDKEIASLQMKIAQMNAVPASDMTTNGKNGDPFGDISEVEGDLEDKQAIGSDAISTTAVGTREPTMAIRGRGRGQGKYQRGTKRAANSNSQGTKRGRDADNEEGTGEQPLKKVA